MWQLNVLSLERAFRTNSYERLCAARTETRDCAGAALQPPPALLPTPPAPSPSPPARVAATSARADVAMSRVGLTCHKYILCLYLYLPPRRRNSPCQQRAPASRIANRSVDPSARRPESATGVPTWGGARTPSRAVWRYDTTSTLYKQRMAAATPTTLPPRLSARTTATTYSV